MPITKSISEDLMSLAMSGAREATNRLLELIEEGVLDKDYVIMSCVKFMSENDVKEMCHDNDILLKGLDDEY